MRSVPNGSTVDHQNQEVLMRHRSLNHRSTATAIVGLVLTTLTLPAGIATATPAGSNGRISYMTQDDAGRWQTWTANPDLTQRHQITSGDYDNAWAVWSPDGTSLAFDSSRVAPDAHGDLTEIFTMNPDGSNVQQVTHLGGFSYEPAWSPDGSLIAFSSDGGNYPGAQGIYVVRPDGSGLHRIVALPLDVPKAVWLDAPRISPDGRHVAYAVIRGGKDTRHRYVGEVDALWVADIDGTNAHRIVPWGTHVGDADWSPDGTRLVFETTQQHLGNAASVLMVNADGSGLHTVTDDVGIIGIGTFQGQGASDAFRVETSYDPVWSPDGTTILFSHGSYTASGGDDGLQRINPDGTGQAYVSALHIAAHQVDWGTAPLE
jgi:Tol biopolymer transport system component